ncbi:MAG TPA: hypothetical protein VK119_10740 [Bacillota bacterium]|nr:hypothetical protein [Bacillota bacterium]
MKRSKRSYIPARTRDHICHLVVAYDYTVAYMLARTRKHISQSSMHQHTGSNGYMKFATIRRSQFGLIHPHQVSPTIYGKNDEDRRNYIIDEEDE